MSVRRVGSLFSRSIKTTFNNNKYANLTARADDSYSHLGFFSVVDTRFGRFMLTAGVAVSCLIIYFDPGYIHECFGHWRNPPSDDGIDSCLEPEERKLNRQIIHREHEEHKLEAFMDVFKNFEEK